MTMKNINLPRTIHLELKDLFDQARLTITLPDLRRFSCDISGDWGPNFKFALKSEESVTLEFSHPSKKEKATLRGSELTFKSPMLAKEREKYPLFLELKEASKDLIVKLKFNSKGFLAKALINGKNVNFFEEEFNSAVCLN